MLPVVAGHPRDRRPSDRDGAGRGRVGRVPRGTIDAFSCAVGCVGSIPRGHRDTSLAPPRRFDACGGNWTENSSRWLGCQKTRKFRGVRKVARCPLSRRSSSLGRPVALRRSTPVPFKIPASTLRAPAAHFEKAACDHDEPSQTLRAPTLLHPTEPHTPPEPHPPGPSSPHSAGSPRQYGPPRRPRARARPTPPRGEGRAPVGRAGFSPNPEQGRAPPGA